MSSVQGRGRPDSVGEASASGGADVVARLIPRLAQWLTQPWRLARSAWRRSIQLRVITATLTLSVVVVSLLGVTLSRQITDGLLQAQAEAAVADAAAGIDTAQEQLDAAVEQEPGALSQVLRQIAEDAAARGTTSGTDPLYEVVLLGTERNASYSSGPVYDSVPAELRERVRSEARVFRTYSSLEYPAAPDVPGLVVGGQVTDPSGVAYELYYLFPLTEQQQTIDVVLTALATAGVLLVLLLCALAWLVARQVVTPVRLAARIAERFSAGRLSERMVVRGRDDMARLALSFNQMAASLQHQIGQLEELSRMQQQFVSDVSHELRTPLTTVRMAADVLYESKEDFDPVVQRSVELLQAQLDRFESLLGDLLEISRFDAGAAVLNAERHDLRDIVHKVVDSAAPLATDKGSELGVDVPVEPCVAEIDTRRIERVVRNLVVNAIEHGEGRPVRVKVAVDEHAVAVAVRDHGVGLKPGESSLVFHRFWRADPARARTTGGTGLGLSISLEDARLHGGWLQAWGDPGQGSQFRLTLPRSAGDELRSSPMALVPDDAGDEPIRVSGVGNPYRRISSSDGDTRRSGDSGDSGDAGDSGGTQGTDGDDPAEVSRRG
ncbi:two-component system sensor histidine kinase MtrB [Haloactinopolyspora alba]|uniref:Sensor histidine kinase MtrB n=1 Tax=Haloactinopolyspora alba TaxID=648780 RepID=A0A2P8DL00_9ACTN|nr:MtrAB system histidine kinase MtrB [Haloactinopolyspora alba]PSK97905.1 two-component system sensor histidine kinase MtrB [Haloactinopolyspora alba]